MLIVASIANNGKTKVVDLISQVDAKCTKSEQIYQPAIN